MSEDITGQGTYLSFANESGFLGACIVNETDLFDAVLAAHRHEINPGGEVVGIAVKVMPPVEWRYRLLNKKELDELGEIMKGLEP